jgi:hypothetical protein
MECGSVGVLRQVGIAPRDRKVGDAERAVGFGVDTRVTASRCRMSAPTLFKAIRKRAYFVSWLPHRLRDLQA